MVPPALRALEALGPALEAHLQLLLPALVRLICPVCDCDDGLSYVHVLCCREPCSLEPLTAQC